MGPIFIDTLIFINPQLYLFFYCKKQKVQQNNWKKILIKEEFTKILLLSETHRRPIGDRHA